MSSNNSAPSTSLFSTAQWLSNIDAGKKAPALTQPTESAGSYFPDSRPSSSGSICSYTTASDSPSETPSSSSPSPSSSSSSSSSSSLLKPTGDYPLPAIDTPFPKPAGELDVAAQLAKDPLPRSLHSSLRRAAAYERKVKVQDAESRARALADAKREWMSWKA